MRPLQIGCVPYLNAKPLIGWFHADTCDVEARVTYEVPSSLAVHLAEGLLDVALVSSIELFRRPGLEVIPGISISADGAVKSVRLFSRVPFHKIESLALDTSSLTSVALVRIILRETYGVTAECRDHSPDLDAMLASHDAGLIIGDIRLFDDAAPFVLDLGRAWKDLTGMPFVYAAWLAREGTDIEAARAALARARDWGLARLDAIAEEWAAKLDLPLERVRNYVLRVMQYDLDEDKMDALHTFRSKCLLHGLIVPQAEER